jgi:hypothetical protein
MLGVGYELERHLRLGVHFTMGESTRGPDKLMHLQLAALFVYATGF